MPGLVGAVRLRMMKAACLSLSSPFSLLIPLKDKMNQKKCETAEWSMESHRSRPRKLHDREFMTTILVESQILGHRPPEKRPFFAILGPGNLFNG